MYTDDVHTETQACSDPVVTTCLSWQQRLTVTLHLNEPERGFILGHNEEIRELDPTTIVFRLFLADAFQFSSLLCCCEQCIALELLRMTLRLVVLLDHRSCALTLKQVDGSKPLVEVVRALVSGDTKVLLIKEARVLGIPLLGKFCGRCRTPEMVKPRGAVEVPDLA